MIQFNCPGCQAPYSVSDEKAGKSGKCRKCQRPFTVPAAAVGSESEVTVAEHLTLAGDERQPSGTWTLPRGPLTLIRLGQSLDLAAFVVLVLAAGALYFGAVSGAGGRAWQLRDDRDRLVRQFERDQREWERMLDEGGKWVPPPVRPAKIGWAPTEREVAVDTLASQAVLRALPVVPALLFLLSGLATAVGRFRLARSGGGSGGGRLFFFTGFLAVGHAFGALAATAITGPMAFDPEAVTRGGGEAFGAVGVSFGAALVFGTIGEALALPGLALIGWVRPATAEQRKRVAAALAFFPFLPLAIVFVGSVVGLLGGADFSSAVLGVVGAIGLLALRILGFLVISRAYRFPPAADAVS